MNEYTYEEIEIGQKESFTVTITEEMLDAFKGITNDINPLHNDENHAKSLGHPGRVVYGMLTASFLSTLAGVYMPGKRSLIHEVKSKFVKPVYIGDTLEIEGVVEDKHDAFKLLDIKYSMRNQNGVKVCRGTMNVSVENLADE